jgi:beta-N-acetylhexosaminidase
LFARNYESPQQIQRLIQAIHELRRPNLLVAVDQEGGRVQRFADGLTRLPPAAWYARHYGRGSGARQAAREAGWLMAAELRSLGVDFSFAPVLDVERGVSQVIGDRAFADSAGEVAELALAWARGAREAGMPSVGKHFPGHGAVAADSHLELPVDERDFQDLWLEDLVPFRRLIDNGLEGIMPAHVVYPAVDAQPAGFSARWLQGVLRERLGFQGVIFSDDLSMAAADIAGDYSERARAALRAGCDMVLVCNNPGAAALVLESLSDYSDPVSQSRLVRLHGRHGHRLERLREDPRWHHALALLAQGPEGETLTLNLD